MSVFPTQLPWRRFVSVLRDLGYRPLKSHRRSLRQFFSPTRTPVRSPSTSLTWATRCTRQACSPRYVNSNPRRTNLFSHLINIEWSRPCH